MTTTAIVTMIVICAVVWGGFAVLLLRAVRSEGHKPVEDAASRGAEGRGAEGRGAESHGED
jgi:hypothetical protein